MNSKLNSSFTIILLGFFTRVLVLASPAPGDPEPLTTAQFNELPKETRLMYLKSGGNSLKRLGEKIRTDDLLDDLISESESSEGRARKSAVFALAFVVRKSGANKRAEELCAQIAREMIESSNSPVDGYRLLQALKGKESAPFLVESLNHDDSYVRVNGAQQLGWSIGSKDDIIAIREALKSEKNGTVSQYMKEAISAIEKREMEGGRAEGKSSTPAKDTRDIELNGSKPSPLNRDGEGPSASIIGVLGGLATVSIALAIKMRKKK